MNVFVNLYLVAQLTFLWFFFSFDSFFFISFGGRNRANTADGILFRLFFFFFFEKINSHIQQYVSFMVE